MKRSQIVVLFSLICVLALLVLSGMGRAYMDGWTWDEPALSADPAPDGWTWDESAVESDPGAETDGWTWDAPAVESDPGTAESDSGGQTDGWTWDEEL